MFNNTIIYFTDWKTTSECIMMAKIWDKVQQKIRLQGLTSSTITTQSQQAKSIIDHTSFHYDNTVWENGKPRTSQPRWINE